MFNSIKNVVINSDAVYPVAFYDNNGAVVAPTSLSVEIMKITNFGTFKKSEIKLAAITKPAAATKQKTNYDFTGATLPGTTEKASYYVFRFDIGSVSNEVEFGRYRLSNGRTKAYEIPVKTTDTIASVLTSLVKMITEENNNKSGNAVFTASSVGPVLTLEARDERIYFSFRGLEYLKEEKNDLVYQSNVVVTTTPITEQSIGRGTGKYLSQNVALFTDVSTRPYGTNNTELPDVNGLYNQINFEVQVDRSELYGGMALGQKVTSTVNFEIFYKEGLGLSSKAQAIRDFLDQITGTKINGETGATGLPATLS